MCINTDVVTFVIFVGSRAEQSPNSFTSSRDVSYGIRNTSIDESRLEVRKQESQSTHIIGYSGLGQLVQFSFLPGINTFTNPPYSISLSHLNVTIGRRGGSGSSSSSGRL